MAIVTSNDWGAGTGDPIADMDALLIEVRKRQEIRPHVEYLSERHIRQRLLLMVRLGAVTLELADRYLESLELPTPIYGPHR